jgi:CheY-like chemotaxis protein
LRPQRKRILLLDDDAELAASLKLLLESRKLVLTSGCSSALSAAGFPLANSRNFAVTVVNNGAEGLHEIMKVEFDVILCDIMMPRMAGDMFYLAVQKTKPHLCDRFLFITGHSKNPNVDIFLKKTGRLVLTKPVPIDQLTGAISYILRKTGGRAVAIAKPLPSRD